MGEPTTEKHSFKKIAALLVFVAILFCAIIVHFTETPAKIGKNVKKYEISIEENFWIGSGRPDITIVEFCDFSCSACKNSVSTLEKLRDLYPEKIKIVFKDFMGHENSYALALTARCAGEQGLFWPIHNKLFAEQENLSEENLFEKIGEVGTDMERFQRCYNGEYYKNQITADSNEAKKIEVSGTPTFFVNGYKVAGDIPLETWKEIIEKFNQ
jgi:protein-disulfide isomerase